MPNKQNRNIKKTVAALLLAGVLALLPSAMAFACREEPTVGDTMEEVVNHCGAATLQDHREGWEEISDGKTTSRRTDIVDEWIYDRGPEELMRTLVFENGKVAEIRCPGYGRLRDPQQASCRNGEALEVGDTMVDAYEKCGEPLARDRLKNKVTEVRKGETVSRSSAAVEEWTFRYGPDLPGYTIRFENGVATEIRTRAFGK